MTITFKANGGIGDTFTTTVGEGNYYSSENFDSKFTHPDGKVLIGFQDEETGQFYKLGYGYQFFNDATLLAQWADPVTVTLDCNGGTTSKGSLVKETWAKNTTLSYDSILDEKPVKEGMIFTGWHLDSVDGPKIDPHTIIFDRDTVVYASYSKAVHININLDALGMESKSIKKKIKLTYDSNGAGFDSVSEYASKDNCHLNNVFNKAPEGKYFAGWAANSPDGIVYTSATSGMPFTEDTTLYAVWKDGVTIHLDLGEGVDGSVQNGNVVKKGSLFRLYDVNVSQNPNGKKLAGWRIDDNPKVLSTNDYFVLNKDITLHAVWEDTITVTIKDPETEDVLYTSKIAKGTSFQDWYEVNNYIPEGKSISVWTLDKDKKNTIDLYKTTFDKDVTLYPVYVDNIKITLDWGNDGGKGYIKLTNTNTIESAKGNGIYFDYTILSTPKGKTLAG